MRRYLPLLAALTLACGDAEPTATLPIGDVAHGPSYAILPSESDNGVCTSDKRGNIMIARCDVPTWMIYPRRRFLANQSATAYAFACPAS